MSLGVLHQVPLFSQLVNHQKLAFPEKRTILVNSGIYHIEPVKNMLVDHDSITPLYVQLTEHLRAQIDAGVYKIGARLPSERELSQLHNVSRMTARQALQLLVQNGVAHSQVGKGTFVSPPKINQELRELTSFSEDMRSQGKRPSSRVLRAEIHPAIDIVSKSLGISLRSEVVILQRARYADDKPIALETTYLNHALFPGILQSHDFSNESLYEVLRVFYGMRIVWAEQSIEARLPEKIEREALELGTHDPVLSLVRTTFNERDEPIEFVTSVYCGSRYQFKTTLWRSDSSREVRR